MQIIARHYATGKATLVTIDRDRIQSLRSVRENSESDLPWIAPGFVDLQINGHGGREFNQTGLRADDIREIVRAQDRFGVTSFCPTTTTHSLEVLEAAMHTIATACDCFPDVAERVIGIHLEGPFISLEDGPRGAHPLEHCRPPDWQAFEQLQSAAGGRIRIVTMSAEFEQAPEFIRKAVEHGIVVAIGHTNATGDQIRRAVDAGATFSTHLGNAAHPRICRHPNYIWEQLAEDRLAATLIVDGFHLPPSVVKSFIRVKSAARCVLISDVTGMAGMPPGDYSTSTLGKIEVLADGRLVVAGQRELLAGASLPIGTGIANVMRFADVSLQCAVEMASIQAAQLVGHPATRLEPGSVADLVLFDLVECPNESPQLIVKQTIKRGCTSFRLESA